MIETMWESTITSTYTSVTYQSNSVQNHRYSIMRLSAVNQNYDATYLIYECLIVSADLQDAVGLSRIEGIPRDL